MTTWDAPNQQVVRADQSGPWDEGTGGEGGETVQPVSMSEVDLDSMTKDELLAYAKEVGASPANAAMTKDELRAAIEAAEE
jgi:hypothetical protein